MQIGKNMFDEPEYEQEPGEKSAGPEQRAQEKSDEFRMHAELAAVFEAVRKFDAELKPGLDGDVARDVQKSILKLERSRSPEHPILPPESGDEAKRLLSLPNTADLSTNDYHIHRRPGEVMIIRWLAGDEVETYYTRLQAHFDAAMEGYKEDERQAHEWKQSAEMKVYLAELDKIEVKMAERYLRDPIREHDLFVLSTQTADEINIAYLCDHIMSVPVADLVGKASAPPDQPSEHDLAWFFKLFSLRGSFDKVERMCFFAFLQKAEDTFDLE
jgi:hypothetical protein